jgi:tRNA 2-thiouridine synthesizing protein A
MAEETFDLRGLKCPLPALRTRKKLAAMHTGDALTVLCTDPLASIDIPALLQQTGDAMEEITKETNVMRFRIRKA